MFKKRSESFNSATIQGTKRLSADIALEGFGFNVSREIAVGGNHCSHGGGSFQIMRSCTCKAFSPDGYRKH